MINDIQPTTYILIGAGGTGSHFIGPALAYLETHHRNTGTAWEFVIIDGDNYEQKNLERQLFDPGFVTMNKAEAMAQMYNRYPVRAVPRFIGKDDLSQMMNDGDTVFIAADNHSIRRLVQDRALELPNSTVINAGNEMIDGHVQLFIRRAGKNETPPITFLHPEIVYVGTEDRAPMSCQQVAELPGGGQLILANMAAAQYMLAALYRLHYAPSIELNWTEVSFDIAAGTVHHMDRRPLRGWSK